MSPEERATKVCRDSRWTIEPWKYDLIVAAIRAAEQDKCEQMALKCEQLTARRAAEMGLAFHDHLTGYQCAQAIRDHGTSSMLA